MDTLPLPVVTGNFSDLPGVSEDKLRTAVQTFCPIILMHQLETYMPAAVDPFVNGASIKNRQTGEPIMVPGLQPGDPISTSTNLQGVGGPDACIWPANIDEIKHGDPPVGDKDHEVLRAPMYVYLSAKNGHINITYNLFCPYNGEQSLSVSGTYVGMKDLADHVGDWECCSVKFRAWDLTKPVLYMTMSHGDPTWLEPSVVQHREGRPVFYSCLNGHGTYPGSLNYDVSPPEYKASMQAFGIVALDRCDAIASPPNRPTWNPRTCSVVSVKANEPGWVNFVGRWGQNVEVSLNEVVYQKPSTKKNASWQARVWMGLANEYIDNTPPSDRQMEGVGPMTPWLSNTQQTIDEGPRHSSKL